ncbi:hypothetical protein SRRS_38300 [Sporomusa rhizae]|uniref:PTS sugar transporter subunit IIA n=1 Tax=Sporomusa rhizae TaxID=357999 RepID=UPI00352A7560
MDEFIDLDTIFINLETTDKKALLEKLGTTLCDKGYVNEAYTQAVILREEKFPTGLNVQGKVKVAIPHADSGLVNRPQIVFASLKEPIYFNSMENSEEQIGVQLVFMLAVKDPDKHVAVLQKLMEMFGDKEVLNQLVSCSSKEEAKAILNEKIN